MSSAKNGRIRRPKRISVSEILRAAYRKFSRDKFTRRAATLLSR
ncbi:hypothetical protein [Chthoniobacter flavus]|nr:hypothetical protein [Chthoniobacter flavus]